MTNFLNYLFPILKFAAIFLSALSGGMALLVDFKKDGHITKWGRRALLGVIISFIIAATAQAIEIYRSKQASIAEEKKTQKMLYEISRGIYSIDPSKISFDVTANIRMDNIFFAEYNHRVRTVLKAFQMNSKLSLPKGVFPIPVIDENGQKETPVSFIISPESALYPNAKLDKDVFNLLGQTALDVSVYKSDSLQNIYSLGKKEANLSFSTKLINPQLEYSMYDSTITITGKGLQSDLDDYAWRNAGGIESLLDLSSGIVKVSLADFLIDNLSDKGVQQSKKYVIDCFSLQVSNRKFSSCNLCKKENGWTVYYLKLPANALQTHLNLECEN